MSDRDEKEAEFIISDRRPRYDLDEPQSSPAEQKKDTSADERARTEKDPSFGEGSTIRKEKESPTPPPSNEAGLDQILALLSGMVLNHLAFDPETRRPAPSFNIREARFFLGLMEAFQEAFRDKLPVSLLDNQPVDVDEAPRLGHIPAILGGMAISALGVDPRTGRPERPPDFESSKLLIDLMDTFLREGEPVMGAEEKEYIKDMIYQAKMYFVSLKDRKSQG
ncbi:hypothetical protein [Leptospirillum ferriphilum]|uniref:DUF1844 domain-containing protein n=1 Tax=Leptospirillum ferriphilum (strain ML-04) TaxID=1048260 RepID=J9Z7G6_LEPFM|nr:hypothetical protein [Leptospirillum ferriphilum]AFS52309.1 hypothetical protein LFML04_0055 [Leptospirillum ferriphilum ML-04]